MALTPPPPPSPTEAVEFPPSPPLFAKARLPVGIESADEEVSAKCEGSCCVLALKNHLPLGLGREHTTSPERAHRISVFRCTPRRAAAAAASSQATRRSNDDDDDDDDDDALGANSGILFKRRESRQAQTGVPNACSWLFLVVLIYTWLIEPFKPLIRAKRDPRKQTQPFSFFSRPKARAYYASSLTTRASTQAARATASALGCPRGHQCAHTAASSAR